MNEYHTLLRYSPNEISRRRIKKVYLRWRAKNGFPYRCDNEECSLHKENPTWNGSKIELILDHKDGNKYDNRPLMLRLLCPNCDSQLPTKGGKNKGRIISKVENEFILRNDNGSREYNFFGSGGIKLGGSALVKFERANQSSAQA